jgi:hypothetical protein
MPMIIHPILLAGLALATFALCVLAAQQRENMLSRRPLQGFVRQRGRNIAMLYLAYRKSCIGKLLNE